MVALLLKTTQENSALTTHFGKAKAFGLFDPATGKIGVFKNENSTGNALIKELKAHNVTDLIVQGMGANPYAAAKESGMKIWFAGTDRMTLNEAIENFKAQTLTLITPENEHMLQQHDHAHEGHDHAQGCHHDPCAQGRGQGQGCKQGQRHSGGQHQGQGRGFGVGFIHAGNRGRGCCHGGRRRGA